MTNRNWIRVDRFAFFDLAAKFELKPAEFVVLFALVMLVDFRTAEWIGTIYELAEHSRSSRTTVGAACDHLAECGAITLVKPFRQHSNATVRVECYAELVVVKVGQSVETTPPSGPHTVPKRPAKAAESPPNPQPKDAPSAFHQEKRLDVRDRGDGGVRNDGVKQYPAPLCPDCGKPTRDAPFGENCQCPF